MHRRRQSDMPYQTPTFTIDAEETAPEKKPRTLVVLLMLVASAATFSYLWAYAIPEALIDADILPRWQAGPDPRPRRLAVVFAALMGAFLTLGLVARILSARQMKRIDEMGEE